MREHEDHDLWLDPGMTNIDAASEVFDARRSSATDNFVLVAREQDLKMRERTTSDIDSSMGAYPQQIDGFEYAII
jgi:hypothetical protein